MWSPRRARRASRSTTTPYVHLGVRIGADEKYVDPAVAASRARGGSTACAGTGTRADSGTRADTEPGSEPSACALASAASAGGRAARPDACSGRNLRARGSAAPRSRRRRARPPQIRRSARSSDWRPSGAAPTRLRTSRRRPSAADAAGASPSARGSRASAPSDAADDEPRACVVGRCPGRVRAGSPAGRRARRGGSTERRGDRSPGPCRGWRFARCRRTDASRGLRATPRAAHLRRVPERSVATLDCARPAGRPAPRRVCAVLAASGAVTGPRSKRAGMSDYLSLTPMSRSPKKILVAVAWPYASGPRHIGHVAGFGVPSDMFARYHRLRGNDVLMVSGTDEHGTPVMVAADAAGESPRETAERFNDLIREDLRDLGLSYDLFTRTTTENHYRVTQDLFRTLYEKGYIFEQRDARRVLRLHRPHAPGPVHRGHVPDLRLRERARRPVRQLRQPARSRPISSSRARASTGRRRSSRDEAPLPRSPGVQGSADDVDRGPGALAAERPASSRSTSSRS